MKYLLYILFLVTSFSFLPTVLAQETTPTSTPAPTIAQSTFPILELGSCQNKKECYLYCQIPENKSACWAYGKKLAKTTPTPKSPFLSTVTFPIAELGSCTDLVSCKKYCTQLSNHNTCTSFAQKKAILPNKQTIIQKQYELIQKQLGCSSPESCRAYCAKNSTACKNVIANIKNTKAGTLQNMKIACKDDPSCQAYCTQNPDSCPGMKNTPAPGKPQTYVGPQGCATEGECANFCDTYPYRCPGYSQYQTAYTQIPEVAGASTVSNSWCNSIPGCSLTGDTCQCAGTASTSVTSVPSPSAQTTVQIAP